MKKVSLAEAKAKLSELVKESERGESVEITRRGKAVVRLVAIEAEKEPLDVEAIWAVTRTMPMQTESAGDFVRHMRDDDRY